MAIGRLSIIIVVLLLISIGDCFFLKQNAIVLDLLPPKRNIGIERDFKTKNQGRADNFFSFPFITETDFKC